MEVQSLRTIQVILVEQLLSFNTTCMVTISNNSTTYSGGLYLAQSNLHVY